MTAKPFFVTPKDYAQPLNVVGEHITVLASGAATGGYEIFLQAGPEGSGPVPHTHPWDESFYVTKGEVDFGIEDRAIVTAVPGTLVNIPAGTTHWFRWRAGGGGWFPSPHDSVPPACSRKSIAKSHPISRMSRN